MFVAECADVAGMFGAECADVPGMFEELEELWAAPGGEAETVATLAASNIAGRRDFSFILERNPYPHNLVAQFRAGTALHCA